MCLIAISLSRYYLWKGMISFTEIRRCCSREERTPNNPSQQSEWKCSSSVASNLSLMTLRFLLFASVPRSSQFQEDENSRIGRRRFVYSCLSSAYFSVCSKFGCWNIAGKKSNFIDFSKLWTSFFFSTVAGKGSSGGYKAEAPTLKKSENEKYFVCYFYLLPQVFISEQPVKAASEASG